MSDTTTVTPSLAIALFVNGAPVSCAARTLDALLVELDYTAGAHVATARNGAFVPVAARRGTDLASGDRIEIVAPRQGG